MLLEQLAERARAIKFADVPETARATAREAIADTVAVTLAGSQEECASFVRAAIGTGETGASTIFAGDRASPLDAALVNGTAAHALDFDDCSNTMGGHPSAPVVPALWALAEREGASGAGFLTAYVAGFEIETKLGRAVNFHHYEKGWHPTSTLGTFGAAAACAHLLGLSNERFANALSLAASMASGIKANFGTMAKPFHVGHAARNGLLAALLAAQGITANRAALEDAQGFFDVYNGPGTFDAAKALASFARPLDLIDPGVAFKRHPCCASTHPAADALLRIMTEHGLKAADIAAIRSWTHPRRLRHTNRPNPKSGLDAKFSVQYVLARAALDGVVRLDHFRDDAIHDPQTRELMARIEAAPHPEAVMDTTEHFFADVLVTTGDGRALGAFIDRPLGRDRNHPLPQGALKAKFHDCALSVLDADAAEVLDRQLSTLESIGNLRDLAPVLMTKTGPQATRRAS